MANISRPLVVVDNIIGSLQRRLPGGAKRGGVRWVLRAVVILATLALIEYFSSALSSKLGRLVHKAIGNLPPYPRAVSWVAVAAFSLIAIVLAWYKDYDSSSYGLLETVCGVVTIFSFLPDMLQVQVTLGSVVGLIGGLYLISEGFSLILESIKSDMASKSARAE